MEFSNTTTKDGLLQDCEFWSNLGDGVITGDSALKARFTGLLNRAFDEVLPVIFSSDSPWQWDDSNHTSDPVATTNLVSGQSSYTLITDEDGNSVLEIEAVYVQNPNGEMVRLSGVDTRSGTNTDAIFAQNSSNTGTPTRYEKRGPGFVLDPIPNYSATSGLKVVFSRTPSYFTTSDTTKKPGIPAPFHRLLSLIASYDWLLVNKPEITMLITRVEGRIEKYDKRLAEHLSKRSRDERPAMRGRVESSR